MSVTNSTYDVSGKLHACFPVRNCYLSLCDYRKSLGAYFAKILGARANSKGAYSKLGAYSRNYRTQYVSKSMTLLHFYQTRNVKHGRSRLQSSLEKTQQKLYNAKQQYSAILEGTQASSYSGNEYQLFCSEMVRLKQISLSTY